MIYLLRILLLPLSFVFFIIVSLRNYFYRINLLKSHSVGRPVISIGNISTGGTGKSPFTVYLAEILINKGLKPAIISRGYKRESGNIETAFDGEKITGTIEKCGDEPMMMACILASDYKNFFIITGNNRIKAAEFAIKYYNPDILILDDAFQHRKIKRNSDIVLIDNEHFNNNRYLNFLTIPSGNLRECLYNLKRADVLILNNKFNNSVNSDYFSKFEKDIFELNYSVKGFFDKNNNEFNIDNSDVILFAGIAHPESFFRKVKTYRCNIKNAYSFRDHHKYRQSDIDFIAKKVAKDTVFITTEKDFVKIREFKEFHEYFRVLFMKIELNLKDEKKFIGLIGKISTEEDL
ncbi:MAG: tetraacyldisaccharide 4'-kinase [Ignavibacteriae bacterium]|nr:tetraacyldisaccharide 4'-kinase [Ignavibacteriota bacterium]